MVPAQGELCVIAAYSYLHRNYTSRCSRNQVKGLTLLYFSTALMHFQAKQAIIILRR